MNWFQKWAARMSRRRALRFRGSALCCGHTLYFPLGSHIFERTVADGNYEPETLDLLMRLAKPGQTYIDVGANIGLLSLPVLAGVAGAKVISVEAAPQTWPFLQRTHREAARPEWTIVNAAIGDRAGEVEFWAGSGANGAFDGLKDTGRGGAKRAVAVTMRTLDDIWEEAGSPPVSVVKIDIEGGETHALRGASRLLAASSPALLIEWNPKNLAAYGIAPEFLLSLCDELNYVAYAFPQLVRIEQQAILSLVMGVTDAFLLLPRTPARVSAG